jgi:histidyl-tRNA synthetase
MLAAELLYLSIAICGLVDAPAKSSNWTLYLGHCQVVRAVCSYLGFNDASTQDSVFNVLYSFTTSNRKLTTERKCEQLCNRCNMTHQAAQSLLRLLEPTTSLEELTKEQLKPLFRSKQPEIRKQTEQATNQLFAVIKLLQHLSEQTPLNVVYDMGLAYRPFTFSDGLVFLLKLDVNYKRQKSTAGGEAFPTKSAVVLAGGRYDEYFASERHAQDPTPSVEVCTYGFNLVMENLVEIYECQNGSAPLPPCFALVCSTSAELQEHMCTLGRLLWQKGIFYGYPC